MIILKTKLVLVKEIVFFNELGWCALHDSFELFGKEWKDWYWLLIVKEHGIVTLVQW